MPFTREQFARMLIALQNNNLEQLDLVMRSHGAPSKSILNDNALFFKVACHFKLREAIAKYLELRTYSEATLRIGLFEAIKNGDIDTIRLLVEKYRLDPNKNLDISRCHADDILDPVIDMDLRKDKDEWPEVFPLLLAVKYGRVEVLRYLAGLKNLINLNKTYRHNNNSKRINETVLLFALAGRPEEVKILLENGANPFISCEMFVPGDPTKSSEDERIDSTINYSFHCKMMLDVADNRTNNPMFEVYQSWLSKNKEKAQQLQMEAMAIRNANSTEHSSDSGSNSPMSVASTENSPHGSPPRLSEIGRHSPPDSPVTSRNGSTPSIAMQLSDNSSRGSTGSSPEKSLPSPSAGALQQLSSNSDLDDEFKKAIYSNKFKEAKALYDTGRVRFNISYKHGNKQKNVLQIVLTDAEYDDLEKYLLYHHNHPASINSVNDNNQTILHLKMQQSPSTNLIPSRKGVIAIMQKYADKKPLINVQDKDGNTPLHYAAASGGINSHEAVDELLKNGADATIRNKEGLTAQEYCKQKCPDEEAKKKVLAVFDEHLKLQQKQDKTDVSLTPPSTNGDLDDEFYKALRNKKFDEAKALYDTGSVRLKVSFTHDNKQKNALQIVLTDTKYKDLHQYLLFHPRYPADINSLNCDQQTVLHLKMQANSKLNTIPCRGGVCSIIKFYADKNPNINAQDKNGNTPLHIAAASGGTESHEAVDELLKNGADATIRNKEGLTAQEYCKQKCPDEEAKKMVLAVFDEHLKSQQKQDKTSIPSLPIEIKQASPVAGSSINQPIQQPTNTTNGSFIREQKTTGLHVAADSGDLEAVKMLVERDRFDIHAKNKDGLTALDLAYKNGHQKVTAYLFDKKVKSTQVKKISNSELKVNYSDDESLGDGASAWVYKGVYGNQPVAVKVLKSSSTIGRAKAEIEFIMAFDSPYIVKAHGICELEKGFSLVLHFYVNGSLRSKLFNLKIEMPFALREQIIKDIAHGLEYAHACNVIHGDLKPDNILLDANFRAVITDLDTLKQRGKTAASNQTITIVGAGAASGTRGYFAPELIDPKKFGLKEAVTTFETDVFSFGILTYTIAKRETPFPKALAREYDDKILKGEIPKIKSEEVGKDIKKVVEGCMQLMPQNRFNMRKVVSILEPEAVPASSLSNSDKKPLAGVTGSIQKLKDIGGSKIGFFGGNKVSPRPQTPPVTTPKPAAVPSPRP